MAKQRSTADRGNDGATARGGGEAQPTRGGGAARLVMLPFLAAISVVSTVWNAINKDGVLAAAGRQGADELGAALKAFPDSIQQDEVGTLWNPPISEIAAEREVASRPQPEPSRGNEADTGYSM